MRTSSIKAKGRRLQNFVAGTFLAIGQRVYTFQSGEIEPRQMGGAGVDIIFSPKAQAQIPFDIECKQVEKLNIVATFNKHARNYETTGHIPLLIHSKNSARVLVTLTFEDFLRVTFGLINPLIEPNTNNQLSSNDIRTTIVEVDKRKGSWTAIKQFLFPKPEGQVV